MGLSVQEQMLIEQRVTNEAKSAGVAYLLWIFVGSLGGHRFYLGRAGSGAAMLIMFVVGFATLFIAFGAFILIALGAWALVDLFLIPGMISKQKDDVRQRLTMQALTIQGASPM